MDSNSTEIFLRLGVALCLGLLVGSVRQRAQSAIAGVRTFPLIVVFGAVSALLAAKFGGWLVGAGLLAVTAMLAVANLHKLAAEPDGNNSGITTEVAALLMFGIGAYTMIGNLGVALCIGASASLLLHFKKPMHAFLRQIGDKDIQGIMQFVLIALVILPVLPNKNYGPYDVINPFQTWMVVVLIVGISLSAYLAYRIFGSKLGSAVGGVLGGLISSTATTVSYAEKARDKPDIARMAGAVIAIASTVAFARIIAEIFVMGPKIASSLALPLTIPLGIMTVGSLFLLIEKKTQDEMPVQKNPAQLKSALVFGLLYTLIGFAVAAAKDYFGDNGLYIVGAISGLTDVDALTITTTQMAEAGKIDPKVAWQVILIGALSNLAFKAVTLTMIARLALAKWVLPVFCLAAIGGIGTIAFWPDEAKLAIEKPAHSQELSQSKSSTTR